MPAQRVLNDFLHAMTPIYLFLRPLRRDLGPRSPGRRADRAREAVDELVWRQIAARRARPDPDAEDILSLLLAARDEDGRPLSDQELRDELVTLLIAGHETTSVALAWALRWVLANPAVATRLVGEVRDVADPDPDALNPSSRQRATCPGDGLSLPAARQPWLDSLSGTVSFQS